MTAWFWEILEEMSTEDKARILAFTTGTSRVPPSGWRALQPPFTLSMENESTERLPHSHTCANQLILPRYPSKKVTRERLLAVCSHGFGFGYA